MNSTTRQGWQEFIPEGVDLPNKMTPGAWVILAVVLAGILAGFGFMLFRWWKSRIPWRKLPGSEMGVLYFGKDHEPNVRWLLVAFSACCDFLVEHTTWKPADIVAALRGCRVYVMPTKTWTDMTNASTQQVAGLDPAGVEIIVGADFAALLHECAHQCEDFIDHAVSYDHATWEAKGVRRAEEAFAKWMATQRVASGVFS